MLSGGQPGNDNATKGADWRHAIKRSLSRFSEKDYRSGLDLLADEFVKAAANGDSWALKELGDRMDGKPTQSHQLSGPDGGPLNGVITVDVVQPKDPDTA